MKAQNYANSFRLPNGLSLSERAAAEERIAAAVMSYESSGDWAAFTAEVNAVHADAWAAVRAQIAAYCAPAPAWSYTKYDYAGYAASVMASYRRTI